MKINIQKQQEELVAMLLTASKDKKLFSELIEDLTTPAEFAEMAKRWQIIQRLHAGEPQRAIAKDLKIGIATVTRGSRTLSNKKGGFSKLLKKMR